MSRSNGSKQEEDYTNVVVVSSTLDLPWSYIPYDSVTDARAAANKRDSLLDPNKTLYVFEAKYAGVKIVAYPVQMEKPKKGEADDA